VSVLSDQVEVQGEKIRDLDMCLEEHREKLDATEETLQQVRPQQGCSVLWLLAGCSVLL
jgi:hypothetical protein